MIFSWFWSLLEGFGIQFAPEKDEIKSRRSPRLAGEKADRGRMDQQSATRRASAVIGTEL
jgi:hypothetical protein